MRTSPISVALVAAALLACASGMAAPAAAPSMLDELLKADAAAVANQQPRLSPVREAALGETSRTLGVQAGLADRSRQILSAIDSMRADLDKRFRFSDLIMGAGVLPAVISEAQNAVAVDAKVMRVASRIYRIDEPARVVAIAPTWRDWLLVGLAPDLAPRLPTESSVLPRDEVERAYWRAQMLEAYAVGVKQANEIFDLNMARLERSYDGMRRFYQLYARGMVTAPTVVTSSSVIDREDPNTIVVGGTVFRITEDTVFVDNDKNWKPLGK